MQLNTVCRKACEGQKESHNSRQNNSAHDCLDQRRKYQGSKLQHKQRDMELTLCGAVMFL